MTFPSLLLRLAGIRVDQKRGNIDCFKITAGEIAESLDQHIIIPPVISSAGDVAVGPVIGQYNSIFFHGPQNNLHGPGKSGNVKIGLESKPLTKRWIALIS